MANPRISRRGLFTGIAAAIAAPAAPASTLITYDKVSAYPAELIRKLYFNSMYGKLPPGAKLVYADTDGLIFYT